MTNQDFAELLTQKGIELYRTMPWREDTRPYYVLVSELMLQQTQVSRVVPKFEAFIERFPDETSLARASLAEALKLWQGLGYNRRAKYLHEAAKAVVARGEFPSTEKDLVALPGVGKNTAGAILVYSFNQPSLFIETNVRTVYIHHFFNNQFDVDDKQILEKLQETMDSKNPRGFYQALMDYGSWLKANGVRNNSSSKHYVKQSPLKGSVREVRGQILALLSNSDYAPNKLRHLCNADDRFGPALENLLVDGLVTKTKNKFHLTK